MFLTVGNASALISPQKYKKTKKQVVGQFTKKTPYKNTPADITCLTHCARFRDKYGKKWKMQYNHFSGAVKNIWGYKTQSRLGKPEDIAKDFITQNHDLFKINFSHLNFKKTIRHKNYRHIKYTQTYKDIPVERGKVSVHLLTDNSIIGINSSYFTDIDLEIMPHISRESALDLVKSNLQVKSVPLKIFPAVLVIFPDEEKEKYYLAWKVRIRLNNPLGDWIYFIDAGSGEILFKYNNLRFGTVSGMIFPEFGSDNLGNRPFANEYVVVNGTFTTTNET